MSGPRLSPLDCTCFRIRGAARRVSQIYSKHLASTGLKISQFSLLGFVTAQGPVMSRAELQAQSDMYKTINQRLQQLIRKGRSPDEAVAAEPTKEFNQTMGNPEMFVRLAFQSLWGQLSPDA